MFRIKTADGRMQAYSGKNVPNEFLGQNAPIPLLSRVWGEKERKRGKDREKLGKKGKKGQSVTHFPTIFFPPPLQSLVKKGEEKGKGQRKQKKGREKTFKVLALFPQQEFGSKG